MTPHSSGVTTDTFIGRVDDIAANIGRLSEANRYATWWPHPESSAAS